MIGRSLKMRRINPNRKNSFSTVKQVALITGAASPLGTAICLELAKQGTNIALHFGRSEEKTLKLQDELNYFGIKTIILKADLNNPSHIQPLIGQVIRQWGRLDLLVNNASLFQPNRLRVAGWKEWTKFFHINALAPCSLAIAAFPWLRKSKGSIVNITDIYGQIPILKNYPAYSLSKAALIFLTKYLASEFSPNVRVNAVSPGAISFPQHYKKGKKKKLIRKSALKRQGTPVEIADAVLFLNKNRFITGEVLKVDGGRFIY
jgi:pteridine reductase